MKTVTIVVNGFIGDILFASSVAEKLRSSIPESQTVFPTGTPHVHFVIRHWEPYELLGNNPFIEGVHVTSGEPIADPEHIVYHIGEVDQSEPVTIQFQRQCGIKNPTLEYTVYTNEVYDTIAQNHIALLKAKTQRKVIAYQANWKERTFGFTRAEYERGVDSYEGYGHRRRNVKDILTTLSQKYTLIEVGLGDGIQLGYYGIYAAAMFSMTASIIKNCDWMIGAEGGLTNLAAGVGTKTIITGDFVHQVYGPNGSVKKIADPKMGPKTYFPNVGHVTLDPFLNDDQVIGEIQRIVG